MQTGERQNWPTIFNLNVTNRSSLGSGYPPRGNPPHVSVPVKPITIWWCRFVSCSEFSLAPSFSTHHGKLSAWDPVILFFSAKIHLLFNGIWILYRLVYSRTQRPIFTYILIEKLSIPLVSDCNLTNPGMALSQENREFQIRIINSV